MFVVCAAAATASFSSSSSSVVRRSHVVVSTRASSPSITTTTLFSVSNSNGSTKNDAAAFIHEMGTISGSFRAKLGLTPPTSGTSSSAETRTTQTPLVIGHRGSLYQALENTRDSFQCCMDMGCDGFELDVYVIADGTLVVFHGNDNAGLRLGDVSEYCLLQEDGGGGLITSGTSIVDLTYDQCQQFLRFNPDFAEFTCPRDCIADSRIPTLEQVLQDVQRHNSNNNNKKVVVKIELKGPNTVVPVLELVERLGMVDDCCYSSFDLSQLKLLRQLRPSQQRYPTGALFAELPDNDNDDYLQQALDVGATEIHLRYDDCTTLRIAKIHRHGFGSLAWMRGPRGMLSDCTTKYTDGEVGNEDARMYQALVETGVQQLCVNRPNVLMEVLHRQAENKPSNALSTLP